MNCGDCHRPYGEAVEKEAHVDVSVEKLQSSLWQHEERQERTAHANYKVSTGQATHVYVGQCPKGWCPPDGHNGCSVGRDDEGSQTDRQKERACVRHCDL